MQKEMEKKEEKNNAQKNRQKSEEIKRRTKRNENKFEAKQNKNAVFIVSGTLHILYIVYNKNGLGEAKWIVNWSNEHSYRTFLY